MRAPLGWFHRLKFEKHGPERCVGGDLEHEGGYEFANAQR